jgi:hypothetical protein
MKKSFLVLLTFFLFFSCGYEKPNVRSLIARSTPYEKYVKTLQMSDFDQTVLGQRWIMAGEKVFKESTVVDLPYHESGKFFPDRPSATGIKFTANRGDKVLIKVELVDTDDFKLFTDLFHLNLDEAPVNIFNSDKDQETKFAVEESGIYLLRLQPELMKGGKYIVTINKEPSKPFPSLAKNNQIVQKSLFKDSCYNNLFVSLGVDEAAYGKVYRVKSESANIRQAPNSYSTVIGSANKNNPVNILSGTYNWYKVESVSGVTGYMHKSFLDPIDKPVNQFNVRQKLPVFPKIYEVATPIDSLQPGSIIELFAEVDAYKLIKVKNQDQLLEAWVKLENYRDDLGR